MRRAGITEAKNSLSALLERVKAGDTIVIEERGVPFATIEPLAGSRERSDIGRLERLVQQGIARPPRGTVPREILDAPPIETRDGARASAIIIEERRTGL